MPIKQILIVLIDGMYWGRVEQLPTANQNPDILVY